MPEHITLEDFQAQALEHPGETAAYVLEYGEEALLARAWLADHARHSIEVQYFIWSTDNIGRLAAEALLRAAERGVKVRVIVDDLLIDAPDQSLLALAKHPNIAIRIYNPKHSVGTSTPKRLVNLLTDFRSFNQRMHDKVFVVDGSVAITGGRNMADEYYDFDHEYNFRDRDVLLLGAAVGGIRTNFENFWSYPLSISVEDLYDGAVDALRRVTVNDEQTRTVYRDLHRYAQNPENFAPQIRTALNEMPRRFPQLGKSLKWGRIRVISDTPGKNDGHAGLGGGGRTTTELAALLEQARDHIVIQSPYLVLTDEAAALFKRLIQRGVTIHISTNSLASTDNLQAFAGYRSQRNELLNMGLDIYEFKPDGVHQLNVMQRHAGGKQASPIFALHAKSLVIDSTTAYIGTFNLDPRSINLNTETGVIIDNPQLATQIATAIREDMRPENSWNAARDNPDRHSPFLKRLRARFWQLMPIKPLL